MPRPPKCECGRCDTCRKRAYMRAYRATPEGRAAARRWNTSKAAVAAEARRDRAKVNARAAVKRALRRGQLARQPCVREGRDCAGRIEAHHSDYAAPLDVVWACAHHHRELDRELTEREAREAAAA